MDKANLPSNPVGKDELPVCEKCEEEERWREAADYIAWLDVNYPSPDEVEWYRLFHDLDTVRHNLTAALPFWTTGEEIEEIKDELRGHGNQKRVLRAEWAVRRWLLNATPSNRLAMENLANELYRSQIEILARYADLDRLWPETLKQVRAVTAKP